TPVPEYDSIRFGPRARTVHLTRSQPQSRAPGQGPRAQCSLPQSPAPCPVPVPLYPGPVPCACPCPPPLPLPLPLWYWPGVVVQILWVLMTVGIGTDTLGT